MGVFENIVRGLTWLFCGPKALYHPNPEEDVYVPPSVPHKPQEHRPQAPSGPPSYAHPHPQQQQPQQYQQPVPEPQRPQKPPYRVRIFCHWLEDHNTNFTFNLGLQIHEDHRQNPHYLSLKSRADEVASEMHKLSRESQEAYQGGDGARAKELSNASKAKRAEMERLNQEAAEWLFKGALCSVYVR